MYGNNRTGVRPAARFQVAGGTTFLYSHPFLSGQIGKSPLINTVDVSSCLKLNDTVFNAQPAQDSAFQEVAIDGSVITVTNRLLNGRATLNVLPGSGLVGDGDLIAIAQFIKSIGDDVGGVLKRIKYIQGRALTRVYYGVSWANVPDDVIQGNAVPTYPLVMLYSGWYEGASAGKNTEKVLWAVANKYGVVGTYVPFTINGTRVDSVDATQHIDTDVDDVTSDAPVNDPAVVPETFDSLPDGLSSAERYSPLA